MTTKPVSPNLSTFGPKQLDLIKLTTRPAVENIMAAGGIRSSKSVTLTTSTILRALRAPNSRHGIFHRFANTCYRNMFDTTVPETFQILFGHEWWNAYANDKRHFINKSDHIYTLPNGAELHFGGLDDINKWRGTRFSTVWINEANYTGYEEAQILQGRLSESCATIDGGVLDTKFFIDLNPTVKSSWEYQVFVRGVIPGDEKKIPDHRQIYKWRLLNYADNRANLPANYFRRFESMSEAQRSRDELGLWAEDNPNALFSASHIKYGTIDSTTLKRIIVAVDPAGSSHKKSDMTGIVVVGIDHQGHYYVLEDATLKAKPEVWAQKAVDLYKLYEADYIVAEKNCGGEMVETVLSRATIGGENVPIKLVHASRGKKIRAQPVQVLYERGLVTHTDTFKALEMQMVEFDAPTFKGSPDRVDALVWGLTFLSEGGSTVGPARTTFASGFFS